MPSERVQRRIDRLLDQVDEALERGDWDEARQRAEGVLAVDPGNEDARTFISIAARAGDLVPSAVPASTSSIDSSVDFQPNSFASGRYTVSKFLGEGGKKKVYLAHDNTLDRDIAFALIKTEGLDDTGKERVKREAQAMGRMGTHPCIMPIYDLGEEDGQPFMVQPLMGGGDVEGLVEDADGPLELNRALEIATQTAQGLSFAHSKGIVHRDLKPGNVWLDEDGTAKIGDFGLAVATDRSRLTVEKVMVGTVSYMPPEQATGGEVTPQADLYSLGAMLYEMCTGRVPFMGDDDIGIISQHINTPPVAPSWHNNQIPKTLDSLILRLLAKDPAERPSDADEVLAALDAVDLSAAAEDATEREAGLGSLDSMAGGVFVGRHREMDSLKSIFEDVLSGRGRMVTLVGEPGIGKTRTAQELATYAGMRGAIVLWGRSYESGGAPPYWPWVQAIRSYVADTTPQELRDQLGATSPVVAEVVSDVKAKLPDIPAPTPIEDPESARFRLFDSISTFLKQISSSTPLVLMLEDLHWSDKPSLMLLEFVARELANSRILIVGNYRDMELNRRHPLSVTLGDLTRERLFERVVLRGLQKHDVQRFIEIAAGITPPSALVDAVHTQTEGNPLFVTETVRLLIQEGDITAGRATRGGTTSWEIRIPEGVREVIGRRLDRLSERCNEVLTLAAVVGRRFRFGVLKNLVEDTTEGQLLDALDEALLARIIEELPDEIGLYQFTHAQMQETLTTELSANRTVRMHAQIAEALEDHYGDEAEQHADELIEHFAEAETVLGTDKLIKYSLAAGQQSLNAYAYEDAQSIYERALEAHSPDEIDANKAELLMGRAISGRIIGSLVNVWESLVEAFEFYIATGDTANVMVAVRNAPPPAFRLPGYSGMTGRALEIVAPGTVDEAEVQLRHGWVLSIGDGNLEQGKPHIDRAVELARSIGDPNLSSIVQGLSITVDTHYLNYEKSAATADEHIKFLNGTDGQGARPGSMQFVSISLRALGDVAKAEIVSTLGFDYAEKTNHQQNLVLCLVGLADCNSLIGNWAKAKQYIDRVEQLRGETYSAGRNLLLEALTNGNSELIDKYSNELEFGDVTLHGELYLQWARDGARVAIAGRMLGRQDLLDLVAIHSTEALKVDPPLTPLTRQLHEIAMALAAVSRGDVAVARDQYEALKVTAGQIIVGQLISGDHLLALLAELLGDSDIAAGHFEAAIGFCTKAGYQPELAWTMSDYAEHLLNRGADGDHDRAVELQDEAIAIATELGMQPLLKRVLAQREILKA